MFLKSVALSVILLFQQIQASTIRVPADQPTIQAGIDAASESDMVLVAPGTYTGDGNRDGGSLFIAEKVQPRLFRALLPPTAMRPSAPGAFVTNRRHRLFKIVRSSTIPPKGL
jgi:hypothetical protein